MPDKKGRFTDGETVFVREMIQTGDPQESARRAGYPHPASKAVQLMGRPAIVARVQEAMAYRLRTEGAEVGVGTLIEIAADKGQPSASRVMAAKELVKLSGVGAEEGEGAKPLHAMSRAELQAAAEAARAHLAELDAPVIEHEPSPFD